MKNFLASTQATRLIIAIVALCMVAAPLGANCCAPDSCEASKPAINSASPCHGAMGAEDEISYRVDSNPATCNSESFALESVGNAVSRFNLKSLPEVKDDSVMPSSSGDASTPALTVTGECNAAADPSRSTLTVLIPTQLKL
jgi:hypothetical protein